MARRSVRLLASIAAVATMVTTFAACGNKQATTDENGKPIVNILVRRNVTDHPMQDTQYTKDLEAACDCTIKWQEVSDNAWGQQKSAKMAAGEFPDIGLSLFSMVDAAKYSPYFHAVFSGVVCPTLNIDLKRDFLSSAGFSYDYFIRETYDRLSGEQLSSAMRRTPGMRVFFANGWYDLCTQIGMVYYLANHAWLPKDRTFIKGYPSGHMLYIGDENIKALNGDIKTFVTGGDPTKQ